MGWGEILSTIGAAATGGSSLGNTVGFLGNLISYGEESKKQDQSESDYYRAIAQQKQIAQQQAAIAQQKAAWDEALRTRIATDSGQMGYDMKAAQQGMGAMPQFNQGTLDQDYQSTKSYMMTDFMDMLNMVESQGRSNEIERLGTATSSTAANDRMRSLMKQYTPQLAEIDRSAMDQALRRQTGTMDLINTNRQNTLNEIEGVYQPKITADTNLLNNTGYDNAANSAGVAWGGLSDEYKTLNKGQNDGMADALQTMKERIAATYNKTTSTRDADWERLMQT